MIRPFTLLCAMLAAGAGAYMFAVKHRAQVLDDQLAAIAQASREDGQRIRVLQAQWALEIDPTRLNQLASQFTTLQPMKPAQLVTLAGLAHDLPAPGAPVPGGVSPDGTLPDLPGPDPYSTVVAANGLPLPPPMMPPMMTAAMPAAMPAVMTVAMPRQAGLAVTAVAPAAAPAGATALDGGRVAEAAAVRAPAPVGRVNQVATRTVTRVAVGRRVAHAAPVRLAQNMPVAADVVPGGTAGRPVGQGSAIYGAYRPFSPPPPPPRPYGVQPIGAQLMSVKASAAPAPAGSMLGMASDAPPPPQPFNGDAN